MVWLQSRGRAAGAWRERGLRDSQFFAWKKRLRHAEAAQFVEVSPAEEPVRSSAAGNHAIEVRLAGGRSLVVAPGFDASHLRALLFVLEPGA
ncbi:MAG: hypothetical protein ACYDBH_22885 [Acidobacteriaceae bacterium]